MIIRPPLQKPIERPIMPVFGRSGSLPPPFFAAGQDLTVLQAGGLSTGDHTFAKNFNNIGAPPPDNVIVALLAFDSVGLSALPTAITLDGQAMTFPSFRAPGATVPGTAVAFLAPVTAPNGALRVQFDQTDVTDIVAFLYAFKTSSANRDENTFIDGSPLWRVVFGNLSNLDFLGVSICAVDDSDPTITDLSLLKTTFPGSQEITDVITQGRIRVRAAAHRNQAGTFEHQWRGGASGDDAVLAYYQDVVLP